MKSSTRVTVGVLLIVVALMFAAWRLFEPVSADIGGVSFSCGSAVVAPSANGDQGTDAMLMNELCHDAGWRVIFQTVAMSSVLCIGGVVLVVFGLVDRRRGSRGFPPAGVF